MLILLPILGLAFFFWRAQLNFASTTFAGPEFHAQDSTTCEAVFKQFDEHLREIGFRSSNSPSEMDSFFGIHSDTSTRIWYERLESKHKKIYVYVELDDRHVRTSIKWENFGTRKSARSAEGAAYQFALKLDEWFSLLSEPNARPKRLIKKKRDWFIEELAKTEES